MSDDAPYGRILLKLSGEALMGQQDFGLEAEMLHRISQDILSVHAQGIEIGLVIGGDLQGRSHRDNSRRTRWVNMKDVL